MFIKNFKQGFVMLLLMTSQAIALRAVAQDTAVRLTVHFENATVKELFSFIEEKTKFRATYSPDLLRDCKPFTFIASNIPLYVLLDTVLGRQGLGYSFHNKRIRLFKNEQAGNPAPPGEVSGKVTDENGDPIGGISVINQSHNLHHLSSDKGVFILPWPAGSVYINFTSKFYESKTIRVTNAAKPQTVQLKPVPNTLDEVMVMAYHNIPRRNNTAAADRITGDELRKGGINPIKALAGKVTGLLITESTGMPGAAVRVQLRGQQSIGTTPGVDNLPLNDPLILLNKVPLITGNRQVTLLPSAAGDPQKGGSAAGGLSMQTAINPEDIESVDILKDADATAIYGSRGAHGAILFTTIQGRSGKPKFKVKADQGAVSTTWQPRMLDNHQYIKMRRAAMATAGFTPDINNAPDLLYLDSNNYVNIPELITGGTGKYTNINMSISGGGDKLRYYLSNGFYRESSIWQSALFQYRIANYGSLQYQSPNGKLRSDIFLHHTMIHNKSLAADPMFSIDYVPLLPNLRDSTGRLVFGNQQYKFLNPLSQFENVHTAEMNMITTGLQLDYKVGQYFSLRTNISYQTLPVNESIRMPLSAYDTAAGAKGESWWGKNRYKGFTTESYMSLSSSHNNKEFNALIGGVFQQENNTSFTRRATGYTNDSLLGNIDTSIVDLTEEGHATRYKYYGLFTRGNIDWHKRYFVNLSGRIDVSSRLGPRQAVALFAAAGVAWIFTDEPWMKNAQAVLSYGKLRGSYGSTGNDRIGDYRNMEQWRKIDGVLQHDSAEDLRRRLQAQQQLQWEKNRKAELALELEWWETILLTVSWYRNVTSNQLVSVRIAGQGTAEGSLILNTPAKVLNTGWEFQLRSTHRWNNRKNNWTSMLQLTIPRNRLLSFPDIENTAYNNLLTGWPLSVQQSYRFLGVDPANGWFNTPPYVNGAFQAGKIIAGHREPVYYGSWYNECQLGRWRISMTLEARRQQNVNPAYFVYADVPPGRWDARTQLTNQPAWLIKQSWQAAGDQAAYQRFTAAAKSTTITYAFFIASDKQLVNASFWRIRSLNLSWDFPQSWVQWCRLSNAGIYLQAQNLHTFTGYEGDPTIQSPVLFPSLRTMTAGLQINF